MAPYSTNRLALCNVFCDKRRALQEATPPLNGDEHEREEDKPHTRRRRRTMQPGTKEDVYTLEAGDVVLQWPDRISSDEARDLDDWLEIMKRKLKRSIVDEDEKGL